MTGVEVWAPAFAPLLEHVTVENSQAAFSSGLWCRLCEQPVTGSRERHAREHERELAVWRSNKARQTRREQARRLREVTRERKRTRAAGA